MKPLNIGIIIMLMVFLSGCSMIGSYKYDIRPYIDINTGDVDCCLVMTKEINLF